MNIAVHDLPLFVAAALLLNLTPGPDMLYVIGNGAALGRRAGVLAALGVGAGCLAHVAIAAVGLSALLAASATAFAVVTWLGAAYLVWMGASMLLASVGAGRAGARGDAPAPASAAAEDRASQASSAPVDAPAQIASSGVPVAARQPSGTRVFWQGALTNALNPKVALFFIAFLPQFIDAGSPDQGLAFVALGLLFNAGGTAVNLVVALLAGAVRDRLQRTAAGPGPARWLQRAAGVLFVGLGVKLALGAR